MRYLQIVTILIFICALVLLGCTLYNVSQRDTVIPEIYDSAEDIHLSVEDDKSKLFYGLTARDGRDGDLTDGIMIERISRFLDQGVCRVSYVVFDKSNNFCRYERTVTYDDYQPPRLHLDKPLLYRVGESITLLDRVRLQDCLDGDITHKLKIESSNVLEGEIGVYEIELRGTNNYGDEVYAKVPLNIMEYSADTPKIQLSEYLVYAKVGETIDSRSYIQSVKSRDGRELPVSEVKITSQVDVSKVGGGQIQFEVTDGFGITGITYLTVIVEEE